MGKSRSAACVIAYLMQKHHISVSEALSQVQLARPIAEPNEGFMKQLELYHQMQTPESVENTPAYQRWVYQREIELSRAVGQAPEAEKIRFEDEHVTEQASSFELRCRKCRSVKDPHARCIDSHPCCRPLWCSAYPNADGHSHRRNTCSLTIHPRAAMTKAQSLLPQQYLAIALTTSWIHYHGCVRSSSKANWTVVSNVPSAIATSESTPGKACNAAATRGLCLVSAFPRVESTK
jgi:hypothetical protein